ncbi:MAG: VWA domain-containing protein [Planctomycetota bacterium]
MGFINLLAFGYLSLIALVVLIYFLSKKKYIVAVPSIIPWSVLKEDVVRSRLFRIDLLFLLQIVLILILIFFLAHPYLKSNIINITGKNVILVIDSSASMQTSEDKGSRFDQARSQALKMVDKLKQWDKMMVISADYSSRIACNFTEDKHKLNKTINDLLPRDTGTNLDEGVSLGISFLRNVERGEMYVLTDQSPSSISFTKPRSGNIKFIRYGEKSANVAISSLDVYQDMFKDYTEREAYVTIKNYSYDNKDVKLSVFLNDEIIKEEELELAGDKQKTVSVKNLSTSGILKARIETDDSLSVDNTAYAIINEIKPINILLVSNDYRLQDELEKIEQGTRRIKLTRISVSEYEPEAVKDYDVAIFHEFIPDESPGINSLYTIQNISALNPQAKGVKARLDLFGQESNNFSSILIPKHGMVSNVEILDWDNTHPTMMHLHNLDDLNIRNSLTMEPPDWSTALIKVSDGLKDSPIAFAGQYAGKKVVTLGFDLSDFDFSRSENLRILIMTLNIIQWLNPYEVEDHNKLLTGGQYRPNYVLKDNIQILNPHGEILKYDIKGDAEEPFVFNKIDYIGEYEISGADFKNRFVANLFDEEESMIMPELTDDTELKFEEKEALALIKDKKTEFGKYLLLLVPFILLLEWLLYYKKLRAGTA